MDITPELINQFIVDALAEDVGTGDHTSNACIPETTVDEAQLLVKDIGIIAGVDLAEQIFRSLDPGAEFKVYIPDGSEVKDGDVAFRLKANARAILKGERLALNAMQRMSGIATLSNRFATEVEGLNVKILDTRKTTPLLRFMEKWAVRIGGCTNYRDGLYDWIMIKDNHIDACGGVEKAIQQVQAYLKEQKLDLGITVEVRNLVELHDAMRVGGVTRIMLDNFELPLLQEAVHTIDEQFESEASGGITLQNVRKVAETGVDYISVGALTHSAGSLDMSLKIV